MSKSPAPNARDGPLLMQEGPGEFRCPECKSRCTRGPSGVEYGHERGLRGSRDKCSRRPSERVDPIPPSESTDDARFGGGDDA